MATTLKQVAEWLIGQYLDAVADAYGCRDRLTEYAICKGRLQALESVLDKTTGANRCLKAKESMTQYWRDAIDQMEGGGQ